MISSDVVEDSFTKASGSHKSRGLSVEQFESALCGMGVVLTSREMQTIFSDINRSLGQDDTARIPLSEILLSTKRNGTLKSKSRGRGRSDDGLSDDVLLPDHVINDISQSTQAFMKVSRTSLSTVFNSFQSSSRQSSTRTSATAATFTKSQYTNLLTHLGCQLEESHLNLLYEIFDIKREDLISLDNLLFYFYTISLPSSSPSASASAYASSPSLDLSLEPTIILSQICLQKKLLYKDFFKQFLIYEREMTKTGYVSVEIFETILKKLTGGGERGGGGGRGGGGVTVSQMSDILKYFDSNEENRVDVGVFLSFLTIITNPQNIEEKFKHFLKLMRIKELNYHRVFASYPPRLISSDDFIEIIQKLQFPLCEGEVYLLYLKHCDQHKQLTVKTFLELMERENGGGAGGGGGIGISRISRLMGTRAGGTGIGTGKENEFCHTMYQKICQLRSNDSKRDQFREALLARDPDLNGRITIRELQRTLEKFINFTEIEFNLFSENLCFIDGNFKKEIDYSFLLLILYEPIPRAATHIINYGKQIMSKMLTSDDHSVNIRRLIALLFRNFASYDDRKCGVITIGSAEIVLKEELRQINSKEKEEMSCLLQAFQDTSSDCIYYPELLSFLSSCSVWNVMYRLHLVDQLRKKQGYQLTQHLLKLTSTNKNKYILTKEKLFEVFLGIGILIPDTALETLMQKYRYPDTGRGAGAGASGGGGGGGGRKRGEDHEDDIKTSSMDAINTKVFVHDLNEMESSSGEVAPTKKDRKDLSTWEQPHGGDGALTSDGKCQIKENLLKKYDTRMLKAIDLAFDLFDQNSRNEIAALDIERVLCALGQKPLPNEIEQLLEKIDPNGKDLLEYNTFMDTVLPYIREKYDETFLLSLNCLHEAFRVFDYNKDGTVSSGEFKYILSLQSEDVEDEEAEALLQILDTNGNGVVEWAEFAEIYQILQDEEAMLQLDIPTRAALRKVKK
jgi:calcium-binding protein CML